MFGNDIRAIPGATRQTLKITRSLFRSLPREARLIGCAATARNAGGSLSMPSGSVHLKK
jgi:hypothetical protein